MKYSKQYIEKIKMLSSIVLKWRTQWARTIHIYEWTNKYEDTTSTKSEYKTRLRDRFQVEKVEPKTQTANTFFNKKGYIYLFAEVRNKRHVLNKFTLWKTFKVLYKQIE